MTPLLRFLGIALFFFLLWQGVNSCQAIPTSETPSPDSSSGFNFIILRFTEDDLKNIQGVFPFYRYEHEKKTEQEELNIWPIFSGYKRQKDRFYWFSLALFTQQLWIEENERNIHHFLSLPLFTRYESYQVENQLNFTRFDSLPLLLSTFSQIRPHEKEKFFTLGTPFFQSWNLRHKANTLSYWSIAPTVISEQNEIAFLKEETWNQDFALTFHEVFGVPLLRYESSQGRYPGSHYRFSPVQYMSLSSEEALQRFVESPSTGIQKRFSLLSPLFSLGWKNGQWNEWQFQPLFEMQRPLEDWEFHFIPFGLHYHPEKGIHLSFTESLKRFFPLVHYEEPYYQWHFLDPLVLYRNDPLREELKWRIRGLFHYDYSNKNTHIDLIEGLLYHYHSDLNYERWSLGASILFSRSIEPDGKYIEFLFFKIKTSDS